MDTHNNGMPYWSYLSENGVAGAELWKNLLTSMKVTSESPIALAIHIQTTKWENPRWHMALFLLGFSMIRRERLSTGLDTTTKHKNGRAVVQRTLFISVKNRADIGRNKKISTQHERHILARLTTIPIDLQTFTSLKCHRNYHWENLWSSHRREESVRQQELSGGEQARCRDRSLGHLHL